MSTGVANPHYGPVRRLLSHNLVAWPVASAIIVGTAYFIAGTQKRILERLSPQSELVSQNQATIIHQSKKTGDRSVYRRGIGSFLISKEEVTYWTSDTFPMTQIKKPVSIDQIVEKVQGSLASREDLEASLALLTPGMELTLKTALGDSQVKKSDLRKISYADLQIAYVEALKKELDSNYQTVNGKLRYNPRN